MAIKTVKFSSNFADWVYPVDGFQSTLQAAPFDVSKMWDKSPKSGWIDYTCGVTSDSSNIHYFAVRVAERMFINGVSVLSCQHDGNIIY